MPILTIKHLTTYHYRQPVAFGEHRMMLRPRDDGDQKIIASNLDITPAPSQLYWSVDSFGNHVATAHFANRATELRFESTIHLDLAASDFCAGDIADHARSYPFDYSETDKAGLAPYFAPIGTDPALDRWVRGFLRPDGSTDTHELLAGMTATIQSTFRHMARHERGILDPAQTLAQCSGSCRDLAVLMIAALRSLGFAARFVSGYLHVADDDDDLTGGNTHAWVQVYVPGPGWVDFDPSSGISGNQNLVRVAVVHQPHEAIPLQGSWIGYPSDHLAMNVAVKVTAAEP